MPLVEARRRETKGQLLQLRGQESRGRGVWVVDAKVKTTDNFFTSLVRLVAERW